MVLAPFFLLVIIFLSREVDSQPDQNRAQGMKYIDLAVLICLLSLLFFFSFALYLFVEAAATALFISAFPSTPVRALTNRPAIGQGLFCLFKSKTAFRSAIASSDLHGPSKNYAAEQLIATSALLPPM